MDVTMFVELSPIIRHGGKKRYFPPVSQGFGASVTTATLVAGDAPEYVIAEAVRKAIDPEIVAKVTEGRYYIPGEVFVRAYTGERKLADRAPIDFPMTATGAVRPRAWFWKEGQLRLEW